MGLDDRHGGNVVRRVMFGGYRQGRDGQEGLPVLTNTQTTSKSQFNDTKREETHTHTHTYTHTHRSNNQAPTFAQNPGEFDGSKKDAKEEIPALDAVCGAKQAQQLNQIQDIRPTAQTRHLALTGEDGEASAGWQTRERQRH